MRRMTPKREAASAQPRAPAKPRTPAKEARRTLFLPRIPLVWRRRAARSGVAVAVISVLAVGFVWLSHAGAIARLAGTVADETNRLTLAAGFRLEDIRITGRSRTQTEHILAALEIKRGDNLLALDIDRAKERLEALPWVRSAVVERRLPNTIRLNVVERRAVALWQRDGRFVMLDLGGTEIPDNIEAFRDLPIVVGAQAPGEVARLLAMLRTQPTLAPRVKAAVLVGGRRWNLRLDHVDHGIDVRLPESHPEDALRRLVEFDREHGLLKRHLAMVDMRVPDRLVVRMEGSDGKEHVLPPSGALPGRDA